MRWMTAPLHAGQCVGRRGGPEASAMSSSVGGAEAAHKSRSRPDGHASDTVEHPCRARQIAVADDVVSLKNRRRLVARQLHRHALGDTGADHVPDGRSPEVVRDAPWTARRHARRRPRLGERLDGLWRLRPPAALGHYPEEHVRADEPHRFSRRARRAAPPGASAGPRSSRRRAPPCSLWCPRSSRTSPLLKSTFRHCSGSTSDAMRQPVIYAKVTIGCSSAGRCLRSARTPRPRRTRPDVVLLQHRYVRSVQELPVLLRQREHPLQRGQLAVDLPRDTGLVTGSSPSSRALRTMITSACRLAM